MFSPYGQHSLVLTLSKSSIGSSVKSGLLSINIDHVWCGVDLTFSGHDSTFVISDFTTTGTRAAGESKAQARHDRMRALINHGLRLDVVSLSSGLDVFAGVFVTAPDSGSWSVKSRSAATLVQEVLKHREHSCSFLVSLKHGPTALKTDKTLGALRAAPKPDSAVTDAQTELIRTLGNWQTLHQSKHPFDVCFQVSENPSLSLYEQASVLRQASPYFDSLLSSGFSESMKRILGPEVTQPKSRQQPRISGEGVNRGTEDESKELIGTTKKSADDKSQETQSPNKTKGSSCPHAVHLINIEESDFKTYEAVLGWIRTGYITFGKLNQSSVDSSVESAVVPEELDQALQEPRQPSEHEILSNAHISVDPKQVYALAHFLELPGLQALAFASIKEKITVENCALELFSELTRCYNQIHEMELDFCVKNWATVKSSEGMLEVERRIDDDELPGAAMTLLKLSRLVTNPDMRNPDMSRRNTYSDDDDYLTYA